MPVLAGFSSLAAIPVERVTDTISRRTISGRQGMLVWWNIKAGAHAGAHSHTHEQIVCMLSGRMEFRIGTERRTMGKGDVAVISYLKSAEPALYRRLKTEATTSHMPRGRRRR